MIITRNMLESWLQETFHHKREEAEEAFQRIQKNLSGNQHLSMTDVELYARYRGRVTEVNRVNQYMDQCFDQKTGEADLEDLLNFIHEEALDCEKVQKPEEQDLSAFDSNEDKQTYAKLLNDFFEANGSLEALSEIASRAITLIEKH